MSLEEQLLAADPIALTQRQMLMRIDTRLDSFEKRVRELEDSDLESRIERRTVITLLRAVLAAVVAVGALTPVVAAILATNL
jgi:hypothetical protein